ncbi:MAG TPA: MFS transporter [Candidatus Limnocylindrales bacterium]
MPASRLRASLRAFVAVLRNPDLRRMALAYLGFSVLEYGTWVALLVYAYDASGPAAVGLVAFGQLVPAAFFAPLVNSLGDRYRRDRLLVAGYAALALTTLAVGVAMLVGLPAALVYLVAVAYSCSLTVARPLQAALIPSYADTAQEVTAGNAVSTIIDGLGVLIGPLLAGLVLIAGQPGQVFIVSAVLVTISTILAYRLRPHRTDVTDARPDATVTSSETATGDRVAPPARTARPAPSAPPQPSLFEGIRQVSRDTDQRLLVVMLGARYVMIGAIDVLLVLLAIEVLHIGGSGAGYLTAAAGLGGVLGGALTILLVGRGRLSPWLAFGAAVFGLGLLLTSVAPSTSAAAGMMVVCGISLAIVDVAGRTLLQRIVPDEVLAGVFGLVEGFAMAGLAIGSILPSILVSRIGLPGTFVVIAAILPIGAVVAWVRLGRAERRIRVPTQEIRLLRALPLFAPVPAPALEAAARALAPVLHGAGAEVIRQGDVGDRYYVVERGRLSVSQDGRELRQLERGDAFGEIALMRAVPRTATVTALTDVELQALDRDAFLLAITGTFEARATADRIAEEHLARDRSEERP